MFADTAREETLLAVERALRSAARSGNRLLSGARVHIAVEDRAAAQTLRTALAAMGARLHPRDDAEFVFVDVAGASTDLGEPGELGEREPGEPREPREPAESEALPAVTVGLDGSVAEVARGNAAARIAWAAAGMPATARLAHRLAAAVTATAGDADAGPPRVLISMVLEPKTAAFALALADAGCRVALFGAVSETDVRVAAHLANDERLVVFAPVDTDSSKRTVHNNSAALDAEHAAAALEWRPEYLIDDGAHVIRLAHTEHPTVFETLRGAAEETTSGVRPLHEMVSEGALRIPVLAVNDARTKTGFDNLIGTGQSCVFAIADLLDRPAPSPREASSTEHVASTEDASFDGGNAYRGTAGTRWLVFGYGPVGVGVARFAAALGARVTVVETDPVRALAAIHDGHEARSAESAVPDADVLVSATGVWHTIREEHLRAARPGAVVAVAGGIDDEIALDVLRGSGWQMRDVRPRVTEWRAPGADHGVLVLADGGGINYTAAEGNPIEVMDLSFATQLSALIELTARERPPGVSTIPASVEDRVARVALEARGGSIDDRNSQHGAEGAERIGGAAQPWTIHRYRQAPNDA